MPTYGYRCSLGHHFELVQRITEPALTQCVECGSPATRVFYPVGIIFKGQGFYKTDSQPASKSDTKTETKTDAKTDTKTDTKTETGTAKKADAAPSKSSSDSGSSSGDSASSSTPAAGESKAS